MLKPTRHPSLEPRLFKAELPEALRLRLSSLPRLSGRAPALEQAPLPRHLRHRLRRLAESHRDSRRFVLRSPMDVLAASLLLVIGLALLWGDPAAAIAPGAAVIEERSTSLIHSSRLAVREWIASTTSELSTHTQRTLDRGARLAETLAVSLEPPAAETQGATDVPAD